MSGRLIGWILMFLGSEGIGVAVGEWFYRLFLQAVPPAAMSTVNQSAGHAAFLLYGSAAGLIVFGWSLLITSLAGLFAGRRRLAKATATPPTPAPPPTGR